MINQIRGLLLGRGITFRKGRRHAEASLPGVLGDPENGLSGHLRMLLAQLQGELRQLQSRIDEADTVIARAASEREDCRRLMAVPGIGTVTATAVVAAIGSGAEFTKGRSFSAWLGLVPGQYSTGGKQKLLGISKRGNCYLRRLLVHGARAVLRRGLCFGWQPIYRIEVYLDAGELVSRRELTVTRSRLGRSHIVPSPQGLFEDDHGAKDLNWIKSRLRSVFTHRVMAAQ